jgi:hypothetical protein
LLSDAAGPKYIATRQAAQRRCIDTVRSFTGSKLDAESGYPKIEITEVPYVDTEVTGIYGLKYFSAIAHAPKAGTATNPINSKKLTIFGGKGGVGEFFPLICFHVQFIRTYITYIFSYVFLCAKTIKFRV